MLTITDNLSYKAFLIALIAICCVNLFVNTAFSTDKKPTVTVTKKVTPKTTVPSVIHFTQAFCRDCHTVKPYIESLQQQYKGKITFTIVDIKNEDPQTKELIKKYRILGVPTTVFLNKAGEKQKVLGGIYPEDRYKEESAALLKK